MLYNCQASQYKLMIDTIVGKATGEHSKSYIRPGEQVGTEVIDVNDVE